MCGNRCGLAGAARLRSTRYGHGMWNFSSGRRRLACACSILAGLSLTACVATTPAPFTQKRVSSDALPPAARSLDVDAASSRYQGLANGMRVYLTRQTDGSGICLVAVPESHGAVAACSATGAAVTLTVPQGELRFHNDGFGEAEGAGDEVSAYVRFLTAEQLN